MQIFTIENIDPEVYRRETRKSTFAVVLVFVILALVSSATLVGLFGEDGGDNFRWNLIGVLLGVALTAIFVRIWFWQLRWMASAVYGWRLRRALMRVTNVMHKVQDAVARENVAGIKLLRFYHLGVMQMHKLDANSSETSEIVAQINEHRDLMVRLGIDLEQSTLESEWFAALTL